MTVFAWPPGDAIRPISPQGTFLQAHVHPAGDVAVFWGADTGEARLWMAATSASGIDVVGPVRARHPVFDPTGNRIAFVLGDVTDPVANMGPRAQSGMPPPRTPSHICVLEVASGAVKQLTAGSSQDQRPCWSPDGNTIVFIRDGRLFAVPGAGGDATDLSGPQWAYRPWFSIDGSELFLFTIVDGRRQMHRLPATGGIAVPFANDDRGHTHGPFADPSGEHLVVHSNRDGAWWLHELPLDGTSPMRRIEVPGSMATTGHGTRSRNGVLVFDGQTMA